MENRVLLISILVIIALGVILFGIFQYAGNKESEVVDEVKEEIIYPTITPEDVVTAFYNWYSSEENVLPSEAYKDADSLTTEFKNRIGATLAGTEEPSYDLFLCGAPSVDDISINTGVITDKQANVVVDASLGDDEEGISYIVELTLEENAWKISNIVCFIKG